MADGPSWTAPVDGLRDSQLKVRRTQNMSEPFLGMIIIVPYNFAPRGWAFCAGQLLAIAQNTALFSLLGTTYGGNGQTNFGLPDLRSRVPVGQGQSPGNSYYDLGQVGGTESVTLIVQQIPSHTHPVAASSNDANANRAANAALASPPTAIYDSAGPDGRTTMSPNMIPPSGGGNQPHDNIQPYQVLNYCIAMEGIFPSRN
jgi:microcystin-dependent protein